MNKLLLILLLIILSSYPVLSAPKSGQSSLNGSLTIIYPKQEAYKFDENFDLYFNIVNVTGFLFNGSGLDCLIHIYNSSNKHIVIGSLVYDGNFDYKYKINHSTFSNATGFYPMFIYCNSSNLAGWYSDGFFLSKTGKENFGDVDVLFGILLVLLPLFFGWLFMRWAEFLSDEHNIFRLIITLLSISTIFMSLWFGALGVVRFLDWVEMEEALGTITFLFGWLFAVIVFYFMVYMLYNIFKGIMKKKDDKFEY